MFDKWVIVHRHHDDHDVHNRDEERGGPVRETQFFKVAKRPLHQSAIRGRGEVRFIGNARVTNAVCVR